MNTKSFDEKLKMLASDFAGRDALSISPTELENKSENGGLGFSGLPADEKIATNRQYFFDLIYNLFNGETQETFFIYGKNNTKTVEKTKADLGEGLYKTILTLKNANYLDFIKQKVSFTKFAPDELFYRSMQEGGYTFDYPFVQSRKVELAFGEKDGKAVAYEMVGDEKKRVEGKTSGETHFMALKDFWPEGIITEDGTFYMTPKLGKHDVVCQFLSLMGENMYNAIRVYNTSSFTKYDWYSENNSSQFVNGGNENIGILFSNLYDYIPNDYSNFTISDAQAKTMLALYHISSKIYTGDNVRRGIHYLYQNCIENSTALFQCIKEKSPVDMCTKNANLITISDVSRRHFGESDYHKDMQLSSSLKIR